MTLSPLLGGCSSNMYDFPYTVPCLTIEHISVNAARVRIGKWPPVILDDGCFPVAAGATVIPLDAAKRRWTSRIATPADLLKWDPFHVGITHDEVGPPRMSYRNTWMV